MSSSLYWKPIVPQQEERLDDQLMFTLRKRCDGCIHGIIMDDSDLSYLRGLRDAGIKDAETLIEAIEVHGQVQLDEVM